MGIFFVLKSILLAALLCSCDSSVLYVKYFGDQAGAGTFRSSRYANHSFRVHSALLSIVLPPASSSSVHRPPTIPRVYPPTSLTSPHFLRSLPHLTSSPHLTPSPKTSTPTLYSLNLRHTHRRPPKPRRQLISIKVLSLLRLHTSKTPATLPGQQLFPIRRRLRAR